MYQHRQPALKAQSKGEGMSSRVSRGGVVAAQSLTAIVLVAAGCSSGAPAQGPYGRELEQARSDATSDFERGVLADLRIDRGEYEEAVQRYLTCARAKGVGLASEVNQETGLFQFSYDNPGGGAGASTDADRVVDECRAGTVDLIEPLYSSMRLNPQKVDLLQKAAECLVDRKAVPEGFSKTDLQETMRQGSSAESGIDPYVLEACLTPPGLQSSDG